MKVAWQVMVDGNLDNVDADYQGKYAFATCYNSEEGVNLDEMMAKEQDWVVIFNIKRIEDAVKSGDFKEMDGCRDRGRKGSPYTRYVPVSNSPHGMNTAPDGIHVVANGKLSPTVTVFDVRKFDDLFDDKIKPRETVVAEPELGLGPCIPPTTVGATPTPRCSSTARSASGTSRTPSAAFSGREGRPDPPETRRSLSARPQPHLHGPDQGGGRQVADLAEQVLQGPLPQRRSA